MTLQGLKLPLTAYQVHAWACTAEPSEAILTKTYSLGLSLLAAPTKWSKSCREKMEAQVLSHIQTVALQWARLSMTSGASPFSSMLATAWAAQSALWQLDWLPADSKRSMILPRLAESMVQKLLQQDSEQGHSAEIKLLALRVLEQQSKWADMLEILENLPTSVGADSPSTSSDFGVALTSYQIGTEKARIKFELGQFEDAMTAYETVLTASPDDWSCWKGHMDSASKLGKVDSTAKLVEEVLAKVVDDKYPLRGPHLMKVELQARDAKNDRNIDNMTRLAQRIEEYGTVFGPRAACAFSDIVPYIDVLCSDGDATAVVGTLAAFATKLQNDNKCGLEALAIGKKERQTRLRAYTFAVKLSHKLVAECTDHQLECLPSMVELLTEYKGTHSLSTATNDEVVRIMTRSAILSEYHLLTEMNPAAMIVPKRGQTR